MSKKNRIGVRVGAGLVATATLGSLLVSPASPAAAFTQTWNGTATYRASKDFLPAATIIAIGGKSCRASTTFYVELVRTAGSVSAGGSEDYDSDGQFHGGGSYPVRLGTAYYIRWRSNSSSGTSCQGVLATPTD